MSAPTTAAGQTVDIADRVRAIAASDPERVALVHASKRWGGRVRYRRHTYKELSDRAEALAVGLREIGVREGTLCSFMVPPGIDAMVLGLALWRVGAVVVGIEPHSHGLRRVARCLAKVGPTVFFGTPRAHAGRRAFGWGRGTVRTNVMVGRVGRPGLPTLRSLERHPVPAEPVRGAISPADPAVIAFTTGSTGSPKPTVLRQRNLAAMMSMVLGHWGYTDGREVVDMTTFPMFWIIGLSAGGTVVVPPMDFTLKGPGDADPAPLVRTIQECGVRSLFASPALLVNLAAYATPTGSRCRPSPASSPAARRCPARCSPRSSGCSGRRARCTPTTAPPRRSRWRRSPGPTSSTARGPPPSGGPACAWGGRCPAWRCASSPSRTARSPRGPTPPSCRPARSARWWCAARTSARSTTGSPGPTGRTRSPTRRDAGTGWATPGTSTTRVACGCAGGARTASSPTGAWPTRCAASRSTTRTLRCGAARSSASTAPVPVPAGVARPSSASSCTGVPTAAAVTEELERVAPSTEATRLVDRIVLVDHLPVDRRHNAKIDRPRLAADLAGRPDRA